jgi:hypothetical protein
MNKKHRQTRKKTNEPKSKTKPKQKASRFRNNRISVLV